MENKFLVSACRFHTKNDQKIVVIGTFQKNLIGDQQVTATIDKKKLSCTLEEREYFASTIRNADGMPITKQYFLWIDLPENWCHYKRLKVVQFEGNESSCVMNVPIKKLFKLKRRLPKYVDNGYVEKDGVLINGWYIDDGSTKIRFVSSEGEEIYPEIRNRFRKDVVKAYPENSEKDVVGFSARYRGKVPAKVTVCFQSRTKYAEYTVAFKPSYIEKIQKKADNILRKTKAYYQRNGIISTFERAIDKLKGKDDLTYGEWLKLHSPGRKELNAQKEHRFPYQPKISIVIPLYKTPVDYLKEMIQSVKDQSYSNWELCLSDGSGINSPIRKILENYQEEDQRIKVVSHNEPLQISENTNEAIRIASGDFIAFADHDDLLAPNALFECVKVLNENRETEMIYTDEDKVDLDGKKHFMPHFKPDFNIDMLRSMNYICHLLVVKVSLQKEVGGFNPEFDGAQDYDFVLRCIEKTKHIVHIPKVLYHWRAHANSTSKNPESKNYAFEAGKRAIQAHYNRLGLNAVVEETKYKGLYRTRYQLNKTPLVSVIIPNKDHIDELDKCICSLEEKNEYRNIEYIIVENNSQEQKTFEYYKNLEKVCSRAKVVYWEKKGFNYPAINMYGVETAGGEYVLSLNNDTEIINSDCLEELLGYCMREDVGAVGARLYYEDGTIQHAGVVVGLGGVAGHSFVGFDHDAQGYFRRIIAAQDYSAVTAACVMIKRSVFEEVGGFDEQYAVAFNDVDLCLKIRQAGYLIVYNPYAELMHYESKSRGLEDTEEKQERFRSEIELFQERWKDFLRKGDPCYSPNLTLDRNDFSLNQAR